MKLKNKFENCIKFNDNFNNKTTKFKETKVIPDITEDFCFKLEVEAPLYAWNYFNNNSIDEDEFLYQHDLEIEEFRVEKDNNSLLIALYGNNKIESLQKLITALFNEKHYDYDNEFGFSNFSFNKSAFFFKEKNKNYKIEIDNFKIKVLES